MDEQSLLHLSAESGIPHWFLQAAIVEYLDCRTFNTYPGLSFEKVTAEGLKEAIARCPIVISEPVLANIHPDTYRSRIISALAGRPHVPLTHDPTTLIPEGVLPSSHVPSLRNSLEVADPKINFASHFQVFDEGRVWQWQIGTFVAVEGRNYGKWVSDEINLEVLDEVTPRFRALDASRVNNGGMFPEANIREFYTWLESIRAPIRAQLWRLHASKKAGLTKRGKEYIIPPPLLSSFEDFSVKDGEMRTRFHAEPIFFRAMVRHSRNATEMQKSGTAFLDEVYSERIEAIINATACLESFINSIGDQLVPRWQELYEKLTPTAKWHLCLLKKGKQEVFDQSRQPYQAFSQIVSLRNSWIHHKRTEAKVVPGGQGPMTSIQKNMPARLIEELPTIIRRLINELCEALGEPSPDWLNVRPGWDV